MASSSRVLNWLFSFIDFQEGALQQNPPLPPLGSVRMYIDQNSGTLKCVDSNGLNAFPVTTLPSSIDGGLF